MKKTGKFILVIFIASLIFLFYHYDLGTYLTLDFIKGKQGAFQEYYHQNSILVITIYFLAYIITTALSLPGATILTLLGGALFGLFTGTILVSFASSIGASLAFLASRFLLKDVIQSKFADKLKVFNEGVQKEGAFYLFSLRLIPIFPFFIINLVFGLTSIKTFTFYWVSQLGMLAGTFAYVNAGTQISQLESLSGILSPKFLAAFVVLGLLPLILKKVVSVIKTKKVYSKFSKPKSFDYNLLVIGAGSAGLVSSYIAAAVKAKVALIEKHKMGGDCLNTGCVPSKALIRSAKVFSYINRAKEFGFDEANAKFDFSRIMERVHRVISKIEPHDSIERYTSLGVECIQGEAKIKSPFEVEVNGKTLTTKNIIVATGARPLVPPIPGLDKINYLTSDNIWNLKTLPKKLIVLGGGPIGCELAQSFARFGSKVSLIEMAPQIMIREDNEASELITHKFNKEGINVLTSHKALRFENLNGEKKIICEHQSQEVTIEFDEVILALGRRANVKGFGLEEIGVEISQSGTINADPFLRTNYPNIFVCGDVAGPYQFTHTASHQAWFAAVNSLFAPIFKADYRVIPWCTFTDPEVARVGLNEKEAKEKNIAYEVSTYGIDDLDRAIADEEDHGFVKVLTVPGKDKILGVTIVGTHAGDIIGEYVAAMKHGFGLNKILGTIHIYPTLAEANKYVAGVWKKSHVNENTLNLLQKFHTWRRT